ncbi:hypothetical protein Tco_0024340 [Tanacetum coccineum]
MLAVPLPSVYEVRDPSNTVAEGPSFPYLTSGLPVSLFMIEDLSIRLVSQMAHAIDIWEQVGAQIDVQQRDTQIQQLQTAIIEMGSRESTLMWCILGLERRIAALEIRPSGPQ